MITPRTLALLLVALSGATLSACGGDGVVSPGNRILARSGGGATVSSALVGTWRRTIFFIDDFGVSRSSETTWQFAGDGTVTRLLLSRNLTFGLVDAQVAAGRYRVEGSRVVIDLLTPSEVRFEFEVRIVGTELQLAGQSYLRVQG